MKLAIIIPAAGSSQRYRRAAMAEQGLSEARSKLDEDLGGRPVLIRTVELFSNLQGVDVRAIIVAGPAEPDALEAFKARHGDRLGILGVKICAGGQDHRWQTVRNALALVPEGVTHVAVHDAARPCATPELLERVFTAAQNHPAVIPGVEVSDTIKRVEKEPIRDTKADPLAAILGESSTKPPELRAVIETVDRSSLVAVQTPQVFELGLLRRAYQQADLSSTDDAELVQRLGERVVVVPGEARNLKITRPADLAMARVIMNVQPPAERAAHLRF
jgi:2-C-methyl-D-erythritol 4-phosphate cytidylyltransferase